MKYKIFLALFCAIFFKFSLADAKTSLNCSQSKIGNLKNQITELVIYSDLKKLNDAVDVEINNQKFIGNWKIVFDQMLNENIDQQNKKNSQFGLLGCK